MSIFHPVGNTDEASSSPGSSGRVWSPFSPFYNQRAAVAQSVADERVAKTNPLTEDEKARAVATTYARVLVPVPATLALGGLIVNRDWAGAAEYADYLVKTYRGRHAQVYGANKSSASAVTWASAFGAIGDYCRALAAGRPPIRPARTGAERKRGATVSLWDDVKKSALAKEGNVKLPFAAYSEMPVVTCPGAGGVSRFAGLPAAALGAAVITETNIQGCASFCYSLKAFGKPSCVARLLVLTLGAAVNPVLHAQVVTAEMAKLTKRGTKILRLFVDGDFRSDEAIEAWMDHCVKPLAKLGVTVYGYSKSWEPLLRVHERRGQTIYRLADGDQVTAAQLRRMFTGKIPGPTHRRLLGITKPR